MKRNLSFVSGGGRGGKQACARPPLPLPTTLKVQLLPPEFHFQKKKDAKKISRGNCVSPAISLKVWISDVWEIMTS